MKTEEILRLVMPIMIGMKKRHKGQRAKEVIECPKCKGRLHLSIAATNGHVWGKCETEGCLAWME